MVLDSLPDQCAKDHTSTEMLVSHATYDLVLGSRFQGCANVEVSDAITREENPDSDYGAASRLPRPANPDSYDPSHALWVHLPIQLHAAWPVPFRLAFPLPGPGQRHSGTLEPAQ